MITVLSTRRICSRADGVCHSLQRPSLCFTNTDVQMVRVATRNTHATSNALEQVKTPVLVKVNPQYEVESANEPLPYIAESVDEKELGVMCSGHTADMATSSPRVQDFLQRSLHLAVDSLFRSGTVEQLMDDTIKQITSFDCTCRGSYGAGGPEIQNADGLEDGSGAQGSTPSASRSHPTLKKARVCHQTSSMGVLFGSIWIRTSTLKVGDEATGSSGQAEVITSFIFYPSSWLRWFGVRSGAESNLQFSPGTGWEFNISPVRAVPETSLIFDLCRAGNVSAVKLLLSRGDASVKDTSPQGWTPLHVGRLFVSC